ncbi:putative hydrolase of the HAD superfamily [Streptomyces sp. V3I8]|uniref:HAD family hydrolase n=1 Tax=Streptomyces sp. V3I8 TaxID=3042279 RepID=UPI0027812358|nr:HAD family hydrolase [Streptomyces sp. V3I8]MDQ1035952.1 putative hydrolase of the HAD superfamily [Streptomyces sp. V3I8]
MTIRAVVWDVDDTIFDYTTADRAGMSGHLAAEGLLDGYASVGQALDRWRELTDQQWARFAAGEVDWAAGRRDRVRAFLGQPLTDTDAEAWFVRYLSHYETAWALFPDVLPVLDLLAGSHRHAVLSNSSLRVQDHKLRVLGVRERFETVLCAAELGVSKPAAEAFHAACDALELPPHQVAYVGDHPEIDGRGAAEAGLLSVWIDRTGAGTAAAPDPDAAPDRRADQRVDRPRRIVSLAELPAILRPDTRFGAPSTFG